MCDKTKCEFYNNGLCRWENRCPPDDCPLKKDICFADFKSLFEKTTKNALKRMIDKMERLKKNAYEKEVCMSPKLIYNMAVCECQDILKEEIER